MLTLYVATLVAFASTGLEAHNGPERIVAVGDLHGDYDAWQSIAREAGLIDADGNWAGGKTVLVQLGDVTDRGPHSLRIIRDLRRLAGEASAAEGQVIVLLGNHEAMNVIGDLRYVHPGEYEAFKDRNSKRRREATWRANRETIAAGYFAANPRMTIKQVRSAWREATPLGKLQHRRAWRPDGELGQWAASLPVVARIGDTLFVHGGLSLEWGEQSLDTINLRYRDALLEAGEESLAVIEDPLGPLWYRGNVLRTERDAQRIALDEELIRLLQFHKAERLVIGHTPSLEGVATSVGGRLIRIDTGASATYGGPASFLEIRGEQLTAHHRNPGGEWSAHDITVAMEAPGQR